MSKIYPKVLFVGAFNEGQLRASFSKPVVHDNAHSRMVGQSGVERDTSMDRYYKPVVANSVEDAKSKLEQEPFDAVVIEQYLNRTDEGYSDIRKAKHDGKHLVDWMQKHGNKTIATTPIVRMSNYIAPNVKLDEPDHIRTIAANHAHDHMAKGEELGSIFDRVKQALENLLSEQGKTAYVGS